jgi:hypothetical protein
VGAVFLHPYGREGIEIYHYDIDMADTMFLQGTLMSFIAAVCQDSGMNLGMQRLHPAIQDFREPGEITYLYQSAAELS